MPLAIHVGGSGQHVALMSARLKLLGALPSSFTARIVDADDDPHGLAGALQGLDGYVDQGHAHPFPGVNAFLKPFDTAALAADDGEPSFQSLFRLSEEHPLDREVFEALFTPKQATLDIRKGFFAQPSLGAAAFAAHGASVIKSLEAATKTADKVFIVGSFIGGTGAGVIPSAVKRLVGQHGNKWYGVFLLNWLDPPDGATVSLDDMVSNRQHGLEYFYAEIRPRLKASVLLGPPPSAPHALLKPAKPDSQPETRSLYPLIAARTVFELSNDTMTAGEHDARIWSLNEAKLDELLDLPWHGGQTLRTRLHDVERLDRWLGIYDAPDARRRLKKAFKMFGTRKAVPEGLHKVDTFAKAAKRKRDDFIDDLLDELAHRRKGFQDAREAIRKVFGSVGIGSDPVTERFKDDPLVGLKGALSQEIVPQDPKVDGARLLAELADQIVAAVLDAREMP